MRAVCAVSAAVVLLHEQIDAGNQERMAARHCEECLIIQTFAATLRTWHAGPGSHPMCRALPAVAPVNEPEASAPVCAFCSLTRRKIINTTAGQCIEPARCEPAFRAAQCTEIPLSESHLNHREPDVG